MDRWGPAGPPEEAYSRVTDDGRYLALHPAADLLVSRLVARYRVEAEPAEVTGRWRGGVQRATRLVPDGDGTPITVVWTGFGVVVRAGHTYDLVLPHCGCDACDEDPDGLIADLEETVTAIVAGGLTETRRRRFGRRDEGGVELRFADGSWSSSGSIEAGDDRARIPEGTTTWPAWSHR